MTAATPTGPPARSFGQVALAIAAAGLLVLLGRCSAAKPPEPAPAPPSVTVVRPTPSVIVAMRELAQLEGAEFHVEKVLDLSDKQRRLFGLVEAEDALLLVAVGDVVAGVDLKELKDEAVRADPEAKTVRLRLPPARILSARLDNERTYVHSRHTDALARRKESLETEARRQAEREIVAAAEQGGLVGKAQDSVRRTVEALLRSLGYEQIELEFEAAAPARSTADAAAPP